MVLLLALFGLVLLCAGAVLLFRQRKLLGGLLIVVGVLFVALGAIAILSFHP
jgi:hypothetical protein